MQGYEKLLTGTKRKLVFIDFFNAKKCPRPSCTQYAQLQIQNRNFLAVQWLGLHAFTAKGAGSIPGWGTKIPQAAPGGQKRKKKIGKEKIFLCSSHALYTPECGLQDNSKNTGGISTIFYLC